jgi:hypothetical protein
MDDMAFEAWLAGIQLMTALQRQKGFAALALAEAMDDGDSNDIAIQELQAVDAIIEAQDEVAGAVETANGAGAPLSPPIPMTGL